MEQRIVLVFTKVPRLNFAKTRLQTEILNPDDILRLHKAFLHDTVRSALESTSSSVRFSLADVTTPVSDKVADYDIVPNSLKTHPKIGPTVHLQEGEGFGKRMRSALEWNQLSEQDQSVVVLGSDAPHISPRIIDQAFELLGSHDAVLGPTIAGGIYLIGMRGNIKLDGYETTFDGVELVSNARWLSDHNYSFALLEELTDVDTEEDLVTLVSWLQTVKLANNISDHLAWFIPEATDKAISELGISVEVGVDNNREKRITKQGAV